MEEVVLIFSRIMEEGFLVTRLLSMAGVVLISRNVRAARRVVQVSAIGSKALVGRV